MGCALVLLFFAVSLTDDLHTAAMLLDECSASRNSICSHHAERSKEIVKETGPAILPRIASIEPPLTYLCGVNLGSYAVRFFVRGLSKGRAPPVSTL